jgi:hypothetical protein
MTGRQMVMSLTLKESHCMTCDRPPSATELARGALLVQKAVVRADPAGLAVQMKLSTKMRLQRTKAPMTTLKMVRLQILSSFRFTHQLHCSAA